MIENKFQLDDYKKSIYQLFPQGFAWSEDDPILSALANKNKSIGDKLFVVLKNSIPSLANETLEEWEKDWGLPDPCSENLTPEQRLIFLGKKIKGELMPRWDYVKNVISEVLQVGAEVTTEIVFRCNSRVGGRLFNKSTLRNAIFITGTISESESEFLKCFLSNNLPLGVRYFLQVQE